MCLNDYKHLTAKGLPAAVIQLWVKSNPGSCKEALISECKMLAQGGYKRRHDNIARLVHWKLCCKYDMSSGKKWYEQQPEGIAENEKCKNLWDMTIQFDHPIEARRPDIVVVEKENN